MITQPSINWGGRIRTFEWRIQSPLPYHLATPHHGREMLAQRYSSSNRQQASVSPFSELQYGGLPASNRTPL